MLDEAGDEGPDAEVAALDAASLLGVSRQGAELMAMDASGEAGLDGWPHGCCGQMPARCLPAEHMSASARCTSACALPACCPPSQHGASMLHLSLACPTACVAQPVPEACAA